MATTIDWKIDSLVWDAATGGVTTAHWRVVATDGTYIADAYGSVSFTPDPENEEFVALEDLTPEQTIEWVKAKLEDVEALETGLANNIAKQAAPTEISGLPWA